MALDQVNQLLGQNKVWQWKTFAVCLLLWLPMSWNVMGTVMFIIKPQFWCVDPTNSEVAISNGTALGACSVDFRNASDGGSFKVPCQRWEYSKDVAIETIVTRFNLVCDREWLISVSTSLFMLSLMLGLLIVGHLADRFGRWPITMACLVMTVVAGGINAFSNSIVMFIALRYFIAMGSAGVGHVSFTYLMEVSGLYSKTMLTTCSGLGWVTGYITVSAMAWATRDWSVLQLAISIPFVILVPFWWFQIESPRWLLTQGKVKEAEEAILRVVGEKNFTSRKELEDIARELQKNKEDNKGTSIFTLFSVPGLRLQTILLFYSWFVTAFLYYSFNLGVGRLSGNIYLNMLLSGVCELPGRVGSVILYYFFGRKLPLILTFTGTGVCCIALAFIPAEPSWVTMLLSRIGASCIAGVFTMIVMFTTELFPTVVRNIGMSSCSLVSRIGSALTPFVKELGMATHEMVPPIMSGIMAILAAAAIFALRETKGSPLMDTVQEVEKHTRSLKKDDLKLQEK